MFHHVSRRVLYAMFVVVSSGYCMHIYSYNIQTLHIHIFDWGNQPVFGLGTLIWGGGGGGGGATHHTGSLIPLWSFIWLYNYNNNNNNEYLSVPLLLWAQGAYTQNKLDQD